MSINQKGFTLIELLISIVIFGIVMAATAGMIHFYQDSFTQNRNIGNEFENANNAMEMMTREIRQATALNVDSPSQITITYLGNQIIYTINASNQLTRRQGSNGTAEILADNVSNTNIFSSSVTASSGVVRVDISLNITINGSSVELRDSVRPRNIGNAGVVYF